MAFIIFIPKDNLYLKRTSRFGPFYGRVVLTPKKADALKFTREKDARQRAGVIQYRASQPWSTESCLYPGILPIVLKE